MEQQLSFISENENRVIGEIRKLKDEDASLEAGKNDSRKAIEEKEAAIIAIQKEIESSKEDDHQLEEEIQKTALEKEEVSKQQKNLFQTREDISKRLSDLDKDLFRVQSQAEKLEEHLESLAAYMWSEYEMTLNQAKELKKEELSSLPEIRRQIDALKEQIKSLGNINVNAIEDYREVSERYEFMRAQHEDLVNAQAELVKIIEELDIGMRRQFEEKFREIRAEFDKVFKELFGGGRGTLELMEGEDLLEAGIQIIAQPPGKKLQNMMQLSGGEKALTAISLLFAIQNLKPSPFCLLDEIEAALDDSNVDRFANYLHKLTKNTQFIVITHRRGTMMAADRLYGITMQEKGVSTLVSVNLYRRQPDKIGKYKGGALWQKERKAFFGRLVEGLTKTRNNIVSGIDSIFSGFSAIDDDFYEEIEETLIMGDLGIQTTMAIVEDLRNKVKEQHIKDPEQCKEILIGSIKEQMDLGENAYEFENRKSVVLVIGVNGVGKTTSVGKLAGQLKDQGKKVILAAADTFRAAAIEQLTEWSARAGVDIIAQQEGSDPAAVIYDAVAAAKSRKADVLICDTAGRLHNKKNLMEELKKINRIIDKEYPDAYRETLVVLDGTTGQNALAQAKQFMEVADITGIILTKLDGTAKGGIAVAIQSELGIPVKYIGIGEKIDDLQKFDANDFVNALFHVQS